MRPVQEILFEDLGVMDYQVAWDYQEKLLQEIVSVKSAIYHTTDTESTAVKPTKHYLLFTEHPPVYTLGKSGNRNNVLIDDAGMKEKKIAFFHTNRGGDITFHGPGQVVGYPILDLEKFYTDIGRYLRDLEEVVIRLMADYGLNGERSPGETGVWIDATTPNKARKICAIGVRSSRWVTMHGFALNVNTDLSYFDHIVPCGITGKAVTSMEKETGRLLSLEEVKAGLRRHFEEVFNARLLNAGQKSFAR